MENEINIPTTHQNLIIKKQQVLANLIACLSIKQYSLLMKYIQLEEKIKKEEMKNFAETILKFKKR